jgi:CheY-like chemotaxis protein
MESFSVQDQCNALKQELLALVPAVVIVSGPNSELMRVVGRAAYGPTSDDTHKLKEFRLAKFALDQLSEHTRERIRTLSKQLSGLHGQGPDDACQWRLPATSPTILVTANDPSLSRMVCRTLRQYGFHVQQSGAMEIARENLTQRSPALVIMDLLTSDGDNIDLTLDLLHRQIRVILLCGIGVVSTTPGLAFLQRQCDDRALLAAVITVLDEQF